MRKKEKTDLESVRRALLIYEETCQMRARELAAGASSSRLATIERSSNEGAEIDVCTIEGFPTAEVAGSGKPDPYAC